jgi:hypothetical protein
VAWRTVGRTSDFGIMRGRGLVLAWEIVVVATGRTILLSLDREYSGVRYAIQVYWSKEEGGDCFRC